MTVEKFDLFAGWLLGDAENGIKGESGNKDLNVFRSALNRYFEEEGLGRPLKGEVEVEKTILHYRALQILSKGPPEIDDAHHDDGGAAHSAPARSCCE